VKRKLFKKILFALVIVFILLLALLAHPVFHLAKTAWKDRNDIFPTPPGKMNDASRYDETPVAKIWEIPPDRAAAEEQLAGLLQYAHTNHLKISIAGARHSMGGHVIYPNGVVVDMLPFKGMDLDRTNLVLHVQAGARWSEVIRYLNAYGLSIEVMQSNDDFSVGGSLSVNCHGWQFNRPPIASTVQSFHLMLAAGTVVKCSRTENRELFSLALGGYGLFGIILDADLGVVANEKYQVGRLTVPAADYIKTMDEKTAGNTNVQMVYGRLRITRQDFLQEGLINVFQRVPAAVPLVSPLAEPGKQPLQRAIFRGSVGSDYGKELRWDAEKYLSSVLAGDFSERNDILYVPAEWFSDHSTNTTDILVECFVPPEQFEAFLAELRTIIPRSGADLLNVTVRDINRDDDTYLRYADGNMISLVMLFSQALNASGDQKMSELTQVLVAAALRHEERYYLPYRLHATREQFEQAYPQAKIFFALKRHYDPDELFQNEFYLKYGLAKADVQ
jgi:FAD/FMN-containing dehydrogenase